MSIRLTSKSLIPSPFEAKRISTFLYTLADLSWRDWHINMEAVKAWDIAIILEPLAVEAPDFFVEVGVRINCEYPLFLSLPIISSYSNPWTAYAT